MTARRLAAVPDPAVTPRAVGYVRVSMERDDMTSPELQETAIRDHCSRRGYQLVEVLVDVGMTGQLWRRRKIEQAVQQVEAGQVDVIVVWKVSRVSRNRRDWAIAVDRVEGAGGRVESATEQLDGTTSTGRLTRGMLAELAAFESEVKGDQWRETHARRLRQGLPHHGLPPP